MNRYIQRQAADLITNYFIDSAYHGRVLIIYGPRQIGKTTLVKKVLESQPNGAYFNCDLPQNQARFAYENSHNLAKTVADLELIILDEAQRIENIGMVLKILIDQYPDKKIIATGSSSFALSNRINEPLTGRKVVIRLYPFSYTELQTSHFFTDHQSQIEFALRFGCYPEVTLSGEEKAQQFLTEITSSYLYRDIFTFQDLRKPAVLTRLLQLLAFQIGSEVSYHELGKQIGLDTKSVQRYIYLLEEAFVLFQLNALSRNPRKELSKKPKIYFYDLGVRNAIIQAFQPLDLRQDIGALWENYCLLERLKHHNYNQTFVNSYFWRSYTQKEVDYIEEKNGQLAAYEFKWSAKNKIAPKQFRESYPDATFAVIHPNNIGDFLQDEV